MPNGKTLVGHVDASDDDLDIALIGTDTKIPGTPLLISPDNSLQVGAQVSTWGYPSGYSGRSPMLSVGYLSGADDKTASNSGDVIRKWAVNAAFNAGNSGGPLLQVETGEVIGVVSSKLAPISPQAQSLLQALEAQRSGLSYSVKMQDGSIRQVSESQAVAEILKDLREQVQLVIGYAVTTGELREFLRKHGVEP